MASCLSESNVVDHLHKEEGKHSWAYDNTFRCLSSNESQGSRLERTLRATLKRVLGLFHDHCGKAARVFVLKNTIVTTAMRECDHREIWTLEKSLAKMGLNRRKRVFEVTSECAKTVRVEISQIPVIVFSNAVKRHRSSYHLSLGRGHCWKQVLCSS